jgi:colicin import membrane protein
MDETTMTDETINVEAPVQNLESTNAEVNPLPGAFTSDDIAKARAQEKEKLYPQLEKLKEELSILKQREQEREAEEQKRREERKKRDAELAKKKKEEEEAELEVRQLLTKKEQEWQEQLEAERQEREKAFALLEQERRFQQLSNYRQQRLEQERDNIIPELIDMIQGNSEDEIEQSILALKEKSAKIFDSVAQASVQTRKDMVGARVTVPASGPLDNDSEQRSYSPNDIANMSMADYAKNRAKLLGNAGNNRGQGLFNN